MIRMVVFDMAGTTVDEGNMVYKTLQRAINEHGYHFTLDQVMTAGAGMEKLQAIKTVLKQSGQTNEKLAGEIYKHFLILLEEAYQYLEVKPQPHTLELFGLLKQEKIRVVLNTGYDRNTAYGLLEKLGWEKGHIYDDLITAGDVENNRPAPDMILLAMSRFHLTDPGEVIKIGDSIIDIEEGKNAGCSLSIGITTGAHTRSQLLSANPDYIIENLLELSEIILKADDIRFRK